MGLPLPSCVLRLFDIIEIKGVGEGEKMSLTPKQEKYVQGLISGLSQREAYKAAYNCSNWKEKSIDEKASVLFKNAKIKSRYKELMAEHDKKALWTREEAVHDLIWLKEQAKDDIKEIGVKQANSNAFLNAIKELNELADVYNSNEEEQAEDDGFKEAIGHATKEVWTDEDEEEDSNV